MAIGRMVESLSRNKLALGALAVGLGTAAYSAHPFERGVKASQEMLLGDRNADRILLGDDASLSDFIPALNGPVWSMMRHTNAQVVSDALRTHTDWNANEAWRNTDNGVSRQAYSPLYTSTQPYIPRASRTNATGDIVLGMHNRRMGG